MNRALFVSSALLLVPAVGCGDDGRGGDEAGGATGVMSLGTDSASASASASGETGDSNSTTDSDSMSNSSSDSDSNSTTNSDSDSASSDSDSNSTTDSDTDTDDPSSGGSDQKFDVLAVPDSSEQCGGNDDFEFSYLWAANSSQGTISKIDTKTVTEVGRYIVRPDSNGSPSRTSVSLSGHVAVANRNGGVTKIYADEQFCEESNGMPGIQTSTDNNYLAWGTEECVAWHTPMNYQSQRPVAWGAGEQSGCDYINEELWTSGTNGGSIDIYVLDGDDGSTIEMIQVPTGGNGLASSFYGIYGGAVDGNGDFWGSQLGSSGRLIRVNRADMTYDIWDTPGGSHWYGMTVDAEGMVWLCSSTVGRFDPETEQWQTNSVGGYTGCMADAAEGGLLWMSQGGNGVIGVNRDTLQVEATWPAGGSYGISIDFEGYIWAVASGSVASKIDPETGEYWTYNGLVGAYTYSDMTGYALSNVGTPSG